MPLLLQALDDQVITDGSSSFNKGVYSNARASTLDSSNLALLVNADIAIQGRVTTRRGTTSIGGTPFSNPIQGIGYFDTQTVTGNVLIVVNDGDGFGRVKYWNGATWNDPVTPYDMDPVLPVIMVQGNDKLWITQKGFFMSYWDGTFNPIVPHGSGNNAPDKPAFIEWHTNRLVAAGMPTLPDTVSFSQYLDGTVWDHTWWDLRVGQGDGDPITGIISWTNSNLVVFKEHSVWVINCDPTLVIADTNGNVSLFIISAIHKRIGCMAGRSAAQVGPDIFFLSDSGIRSVARTLASENQNVVGPALSDPINDIIERINPAGLDNVSGFYWNNRYLCALPLDEAIYPNYTVVYNTITQSWSGYWTSITPTCFTRRIHGTTPKLTFGQDDGSIVDFMDYIPESSATAVAFQDQAVDYPTMILSKAYTCGDPDSPKTGLFTRLEFNRSSAEVEVCYIIDGSNEMVQDTFSTDGGILYLPLVVPFDLPISGAVLKSFDLQHLGQFRELQIQVDSDAGKISLNKISIGAFMDSYVIQE